MLFCFVEFFYSNKLFYWLNEITFVLKLTTVSKLFGLFISPFRLVGSCRRWSSYSFNSGCFTYTKVSHTFIATTSKRHQPERQFWCNKERNRDFTFTRTTYTGKIQIITLTWRVLIGRKVNKSVLVWYRTLWILKFLIILINDSWSSTGIVDK